MTGARALEVLIKREAGEAYLSSKGNVSKYEPWCSSRIAEPSRPELCCDMVQHLPPEQAALYSSESRVLEGGLKDEAPIK